MLYTILYKVAPSTFRFTHIPTLSSRRINEPSVINTRLSPKYLSVGLHHALISCSLRLGVGQEHLLECGRGHCVVLDQIWVLFPQLLKFGEQRAVLHIHVFTYVVVQHRLKYEKDIINNVGALSN